MSSLRTTGATWPIRRGPPSVGAGPPGGGRGPGRGGPADVVPEDDGDDLTDPTGATFSEGRTSRRGRRHGGEQKKGSLLRELPVLLLIAFVLALVVKTFFVQAFFIPSGSME